MCTFSSPSVFLKGFRRDREYFQFIVQQVTLQLKLNVLKNEMFSIISCGFIQTGTHAVPPNVCCNRGTAPHRTIGAQSSTPYDLGLTCASTKRPCECFCFCKESFNMLGNKKNWISTCNALFTFILQMSTIFSTVC